MVSAMVMSFMYEVETDVRVAIKEETSDAALSKPGEPQMVTKGIRRDESRSPRMRSEGVALDVQYQRWPRNSTSSPKSS